MTFNDTAGAYGLFQVVFANLTENLAVATFRLRERKEPGLKFEKVFDQPFKQLFRQFRAELKQFNGRSSVSAEVCDLREACKIISKVSVWRNERVHARVHMTDTGYALYDWRTGKRLEIHRDVITQHIELAIKVIVALEAHVQHLIGQMDFDKEVERLFSALPEFSEPDDAGADSATA